MTLCCRSGWCEAASFVGGR